LAGRRPAWWRAPSCAQHEVARTSGYMAPELLDSSSPPDLTVMSMRLESLLNEVVSEEEPYSDQLQNFRERGPFGR
ncbi:hypothetical protein BV898_16757, partial [Hypsibius exemplaris]